MSLSASPQAAPPAKAPASAQQPAATAQKAPAAHHSSRKSSKKKAAEPEVAEAPAPPPTPEQMPPSPPNVTYQNGQLTIQSQNATLAQVLRAVQQKTGASFEIPGSAGNERVVAQLGPGQPKDILNTLLNGSKFDYIILGVRNNPGAVQKVILTPRQSGPASTPVNAAQATPPQSVMPPPGMQQQPDSDEVQPEDDNSVPEPSAEDQGEQELRNPQGGPSFIPQQQPGNPATGSPVPGNPPNGMAPPAPGAVGPQGGPQGVKTPEQLLQELQRMQQQQQQYQQQLNPANQQQQPEDQQ